MKTILVPTDFSLTAENALRYAIPIAQREKAKVVLVHAYHIDSIYTQAAFPSYFIEEEILSVRLRTEHLLKTKCSSLTDDYKIECDYLSVLGSPGDSIRKVIGQIKPALVVMGTNGAHTLTERLFGSTTANIVSKSGAAVLVIPGRAKYHHIQKIAFATDFQQKDTYLLKKLGELALLFPAHISVIWIADGLDLDACKKHLDEFKIRAAKKLREVSVSYHLVSGKDVSGELLKIGKNKRYDLLSMITHKRSFLESLINQSMTKKIANSLKIPLLAMQTQ